MDNECESIWIKPYEIEKFTHFNLYFIKDLNGNILNLPINEHHLKYLFTLKHPWPSKSTCTYSILCILQFYFPSFVWSDSISQWKEVGLIVGFSLTNKQSVYHSLSQLLITFYIKLPLSYKHVKKIMKFKNN